MLGFEFPGKRKTRAVPAAAVPTAAPATAAAAAAAAAAGWAKKPQRAANSDVLANMSKTFIHPATYQGTKQGKCDNNSHGALRAQDGEINGESDVTQRAFLAFIKLRTAHIDTPNEK